MNDDANRWFNDDFILAVYWDQHANSHRLATIFNEIFEAPDF